MTESYHVSMHYDFPKNDFPGTQDELLGVMSDLTSRMTLGLRRILSENHDFVEVCVEIYRDFGLPGYKVNFEDSDIVSLGDAVSDFVDIAGVPNFVSGEYKLTLPILNSKGFGLERRTHGWAIGRHVVSA